MWTINHLESGHDFPFYTQLLKIYSIIGIIVFIFAYNRGTYMTLFGTPFEDLKPKYQKKLRNNSWFHGTSLSNLESLKRRPLVDYNIGKELDFGFGFYLAPNLEMASRYTKNMISYMKDTGFTFSKDEITPIVIEYELNPDVEHFFTNPSYKTICFPEFSVDFAKFILSNRLNPDQRNHNFDLIYGVMSDGNPNVLVPLVRRQLKTEEEFVQEIVSKTTSTRQLSVHNQEICDMLILKDVHYVEEGVVKDVEYIGHGK